MAGRLLLDTDVVVEYLRGAEPAVAYLEGRSEGLLLSAITVAELFAGVRDGKERTALDAFLSAFEVIPVDRGIAERGGLHRRRFGPSHGVGLADALVAATAELTDSELVTMNVRHFPMFSGLAPPFVKPRGSGSSRSDGE